MAVRNSHARSSRNYVSFNYNGLLISLYNKNCYSPKSRLYSLKKKITTGKIVLPETLSPYKIYNYCDDGTVEPMFIK